MKKSLLLSAALFAAAQAAWGYIVEIPSLEVGGEKYPRSVYSKILITPGTPTEYNTEPSLQIGGETPVPRSVYSKIRIAAGTPAIENSVPSLQIAGGTPVSRSVYSKIRVNSDSYTLVSSTPASAPNLTYSFSAAPSITVFTHNYTTPAVSGTYTLESTDQAVAPDRTYSISSAPSIALLSHTYVTPGESGAFTLVSNDPKNYADVTYAIDENPQVFVVTELKDIQTTVEEIESEETGHLTYHPATQSLRANWAESREIRIYSVSGQRMLTGWLGGADRTLSVAGLPTGVYVVTVHGATPHEPLKFLKQ